MVRRFAAIWLLMTVPAVCDPAPVPPASLPSDPVGIAKVMSPGWNLGNSLESMGQGSRPARSSQETAWGNAGASQKLMTAVKAAGFNSIRIPVSWNQYANGDGEIRRLWLDRVGDVVDYARAANLYVIINVHWDGGWVVPTADKAADVNARLTKFWTQIANYFGKYDDHLLFAGTNEIGAPNESGPPKPENCAIQNGFNQTFVKAVRATGGNNATRWLVVQAYNTNIDAAVSCNATLPADTVPNRLMMEVHYYDPFHFTIDDKSDIWQWGSIATDPKAKDNWGDEAWADAQFQKMKSTFVDKGIPVVLGEYAALRRTEHDPQAIYFTYWDRYITQSAYRHGLVPMYWDPGYLSNHSSGLFNRATGEQAFPQTVKAIVDAVKQAP